MNPEQMAHWAWSHACEKCQTEGDCEIEECLNAERGLRFSEACGSIRRQRQLRKIRERLVRARSGIGDFADCKLWIPTCFALAGLSKRTLSLLAAGQFTVNLLKSRVPSLPFFNGLDNFLNLNLMDRI